jgi:hypothetical protein
MSRFRIWADQAPIEVVPVSLDCFVSGFYRLEASRLFLLSDQTRPLGLVSRTQVSLADQIAGLPAGRIILVDDDIATGTTMRAVTDMIAKQRPDIDVVGWRSLLAEMTYQPGHAESLDDIFDVVDARDFLPVLRSGLLVTDAAGGIDAPAHLDNMRRERLLYTDERIDLTLRAKLHPDRIEAFRATVAEHAPGVAAGRSVSAPPSAGRTVRSVNGYGSKERIEVPA